MTYQIRYCAFVDILGFTGLVSELEKGTVLPETLRDILGEIHKPPSAIFTAHAESDLKAQSISDAVCLSAACTAAGLSHLFHNLESLTIDLLKRGYFLRGAIVKGKLYHDTQMVFGQALVHAYQMESSVVHFPRIVISSDVRSDAATFAASNAAVGPLLECMRQADDGPFYLHALRIMSVVLRGNGEEWKGHVPNYNLIADQIQRRFDQAVDNPSHFAEVQWFARYWNDVAFHRGNRVKTISGPNVAYMLNLGLP